MRSSPTSALVPASLVLQSHQKIRYVSIDCDFDSDWSMIVDHHKRSISGQKPAKDAGQRATRGGSLSWTNISRLLLQMSVLTIGLSSTLMWMLKEQVADWLVTGLLALPAILWITTDIWVNLKRISGWEDWWDWTWKESFSSPGSSRLPAASPKRVPPPHIWQVIKRPILSSMWCKTGISRTLHLNQSTLVLGWGNMT